MNPTARDIEEDSKRQERDSAMKRIAALREKGVADPEHGGTLHVVTSRGIPNRRRAGIQFNAKARTPVAIDIDATDDQIAKRVAGGEAVVNALGYFAIVGDDGLVAHTTPADSADTAELQSRAAESDRLAAENAALRQEMAEMRAAAEAKNTKPTGKPDPKAIGASDFGGSADSKTTPDSKTGK